MARRLRLNSKTMLAGGKAPRNPVLPLDPMGATFVARQGTSPRIAAKTEVEMLKIRAGGEAKTKKSFFIGAGEAKEQEAQKAQLEQFKQVEKGP